MRCRSYVEPATSAGGTSDLAWGTPDPHKSALNERKRGEEGGGRKGSNGRGDRDDSHLGTGAGRHCLHRQHRPTEAAAAARDRGEGGSGSGGAVCPMSPLGETTRGSISFPLMFHHWG